MTAKRVVVIEGDDAAPEAVRPTLALLERLDLDIEWVHPPYGEAAMVRYGTPFPDNTKQAIDTSDTALFGATSGSATPVLHYLRWGKDTYANVRPARWLPGFKSPLAHPEGIDFVILRENLEDLAAGVEGDLEQLRPIELHNRAGRAVADLGPGQFAVKVITETSTERIARFAFELARQRKDAGKPGKVTCATKHNLMPRSDGLFRKVVLRVARDYPDIRCEGFIVDDFARRLIVEPQQLDVVVLPSLYGDIFSDAAGGVIGGLGLCPSGVYGDHYAYFEPIHGSAPDIAGKNIINPTASILTAALMLDHLGFAAAAQRLRTAVEQVYAEGQTLTLDQGGRATTQEFCDAVAGRL
jgi:isocitrate/isopropylmalate dehydrogenase